MSKRRNYPGSQNPEARLAAIEERGSAMRRRRTALTGGLAAVVVLLVGVGSLSLLGSNDPNDTTVIAAPHDGDSSNESADQADGNATVEPGTGETDESASSVSIGLTVDWDAPADARTLPVTLNSPETVGGSQAEHCVQVYLYPATSVTGTTEVSSSDISDVAAGEYLATGCRNLGYNDATSGIEADFLTVRPTMGVEIGCAVSIERNPLEDADAGTDSGDTAVEGDSTDEEATNPGEATDPLTDFVFDLGEVSPGAYQVVVSAGAGLINTCPTQGPSVDPATQKYFNALGTIQLP